MDENKRIDFLLNNLFDPWTEDITKEDVKKKIADDPIEIIDGLIIIIKELENKLGY